MPKTRDEINSLLRSNNRAVEVGIYRIFQLQTEDEQANENTKHLNNVGFAHADAKYGTYLARWVEQGKSLSGRHLARARKMCLKYSRQLTAIANGELSCPVLPKRMARKRPQPARHEAEDYGCSEEAIELRNHYWAAEQTAIDAQYGV